MFNEIEPHAVRWAIRKIRNEMDWTRWHWTETGDFTLCGLPIKMATPVLMFPEMNEKYKVDCKKCLLKLKAT